ncbi:MAG: hypothetical protein KDB18_12220, partial [Salinibacterium sp.]|nr:hypothetical protein [Salinibacterium sp.]
MKLEKEKIAFIVVLLLVGWLGWSEFSTDRTKGQRKSRGRAGDVEELDLTTLSAAELQLDRSTWDFSGRNVFRQPSELSPLPPLTLPVPPRTPLPVAPPATIPGPNPFHRLSTVTVPETIAGVRLQTQNFASGSAIRRSAASWASPGESTAAASRMARAVAASDS